jgi:hypothetical protein
MLVHASSKLTVDTMVHESVEGRSGNDSHLSEDTMLPIWEQEDVVRPWESGRRQPEAAARALLTLIAADPQFVMRTLAKSA